MARPRDEEAYNKDTGTKDKPTKNPARVVHALNSLGQNWTVDGKTLTAGVTAAYSKEKDEHGNPKKLEGTALKVLQNVDHCLRAKQKPDKEQVCRGCAVGVP